MLKHQHSIRRIISAIALALVPLAAHADNLSPRSLQLGNSADNVVTTHAFQARTATSATIGSIKFQYCTAASGVCLLPNGIDATGATLTAQSGATGFTMNNSVNGSPFITRSAALVASGTNLGYTLGNILNPDNTNDTFYVRITTYIGTDGSTSPIDVGIVAASTAQPIVLSGVTPELLVFCVGITITTDCTTASGNAINFGDFSSQATRTATSAMQASTNAAGGYGITVNGTTLASGSNVIPALATRTASSTNTGQFGLNLRNNNTPNIGTDPTVAAGASGTYSPEYGTVDQYRFTTGDIVAQAAAPTNANTYTASYIVNIGGSQAAGIYTATMTYICTASF